MHTLIKKILSEFEPILLAKRKKWYARLYPPADQEQFLDLERILGFGIPGRGIPIPSAFRELYTWRKGEGKSGGIRPGFHWYDITGVGGVFLDYQKDLVLNQYPPLFKRLIPLFRTDTRHDIFLLAHADPSVIGEILLADVIEREFYRVSNSLANFLQIVSKGWETGVYSENADSESPFVYSDAELTTIREIDGDNVLPFMEYGKTRFGFDDPQHWPDSWNIP